MDAPCSFAIFRFPSQSRPGGGKQEFSLPGFAAGMTVTGLWARKPEGESPGQRKRPGPRTARTARRTPPMREIGHFIAGKPVAGTSGRYGDVFNPASGEVTARVALAGGRRGGPGGRPPPPPPGRPGPPRRRCAAPGSCSSSGTCWSATARDCPPSSPPSTARCCPTPTARCSAAWKWSNSPAASRTCSRASSPNRSAPASTPGRCASRSASSPASRRSTSR